MQIDNGIPEKSKSRALPVSWQLLKAWVRVRKQLQISNDKIQSVQFC